MADTVCIYFQVHQPYRIRLFTLFNRGEPYFDEGLNRDYLLRAAGRCYLPANAMMMRLFRRHEGRFTAGFSLSGTAVSQFREHVPEAIDSFAELGAAGAAEFLCETDHHSLACVFSPAEFREQVEAHRALISDTTGCDPKVFRNTELIYRDGLAAEAESLGFGAVLAEGLERILAGRSPHHIYTDPPGKVRLLLKNHRLSDDIAFKYSDRSWPGWPLEPEAFAARLRDADGELVNLFLDYETLGEHHVADTGIFDFFERMVDTYLAFPGTRVAGPGAVAEAFAPRGVYSAPDFISWADEARDLSAWLGNDMQTSAAGALYALEEPIREAGDTALLADWRKLQSSDHLYYMSTKGAADGGVHTYFNPYQTPHDAFACFMNILHNLERRVREVS